VVRASDLQPIGNRFESRPLCFTCISGQVVDTHVPLFTKQYKLIPAQAAAGVWLRAVETEISAALWALWLVKDFNFSFDYGTHCIHNVVGALQILWWCWWCVFILLLLHIFIPRLFLPLTHVLLAIAILLVFTFHCHATYSCSTEMNCLFSW